MRRLCRLIMVANPGRGRFSRAFQVILVPSQNPKIRMKLLVTLTLLFTLTCWVKDAQINEHNVVRQKLSSLNITPETLPSKEQLPDGISRLIKAYPDYIVGGTPNEVRWKDGSVMAYDDDLRNKTFAELLNN